LAFTVTAQTPLRIEPYPEVEQPDRDEEEQSIDLLYRNKRTYAIGHGCAAGWSDVDDGTVTWVRSEPLPAYEVVSLTPDIYVTGDDGEKTPVAVSMAALAAGSDEGDEQVERVLALYGVWIEAQDALIQDLPERLREAAQRHVAKCRDALERM